MSTPRAVLLPLLSVLLVLPSAADAQRRPALPDGVLQAHAIGIFFKCSSTARITLASIGRCVFSARQCW